MTNRNLFVIFIFLATALEVGFAQEPPSSDPCAEATTTLEMQECLQVRYEKADADLNLVYKLLKSKLSERRQIKLQAVQRAWIFFRDKSAEFEASEEEDGSMYPLIYQLTLAEMTEKRVEKLKQLIQRIDKP
ncbi:MAG: lysozyme inhibitor LprI family protein [bacterium]